jgi:hypothetical protein
MARPVNESLEYINIDINFFDDIKILFVSERFAEKGELISIKILLWIYRQGYYTQWNEEIAMLFAKKNFKNVSFELVNDVIGELIKRGFLNEEMFKKFGILTSNGIQKRWFEVITKAKRKCSIRPEYNLLIPKIKEETPAKLELIPSGIEETPPERVETTQSKVKESKENKEYKESWHKDKLDFLNNSIWKENFCIGRHITLERLEKLQKDFLVDIELKKETTDNLYRYFTNIFDKKRDFNVDLYSQKQLVQ